MTDPTPPAGDKSISGVGHPTRRAREMAEEARAAQQRQDPRSNVFDMEAQARAPGTPVLTFAYLNHRGRIGERKVRPIETWYGVSQWYGGGPAYYLRAFDLDRQAERDFRFERINPPPTPGFQTILQAIWQRMDNAIKQGDDETAARLTLLDHIARLTLLPGIQVRDLPDWRHVADIRASTLGTLSPGKIMDEAIAAVRKARMELEADGVTVAPGRQPDDPPPPGVEIIPGLRRLDDAPEGVVAFELAIGPGTDLGAVLRAMGETLAKEHPKGADTEEDFGLEPEELTRLKVTIFVDQVLMPAIIPYLTPGALVPAHAAMMTASLAEYANPEDDRELGAAGAAAVYAGRMWEHIHPFIDPSNEAKVRQALVDAMVEFADAEEPPPVGQNDREDLPLETQHQLREAAETFLDEMAGEESFEAADFVADVARELEAEEPAPPVVIGKLDADTLATLRNDLGHGGLFMPLDLSDLTVVTPGAGHTGPGLTFTAPATPVVTDAMVDAAFESWVKSAESVNLAINRNPSVVASIRQGLRDALEAAAAAS